MTFNQQGVARQDNAIEEGSRRGMKNSNESQFSNRVHFCIKKVYNMH